MDMNEYKEQLLQINNLLSNTPEGQERTELLVLKGNIEELLSLADDTQNEPQNNEEIDEYALFMAEMEKEGALDKPQLKNVEGKKCKAPHKHQWGQIVYHNAMVCSVMPQNSREEEMEVKVLFLNPTHQEMLPCPYFFDPERDCKFSEEKCKFSHGETVLYSSLQDYVEPNGELAIGTRILVKQNDNLWYRAKIKHIYDEKCLVKFESNSKKHEEVAFEDIVALGEDINTDSEDSEEEQRVENDEDVINMSLMNCPTDQALGDWEKYTKGIGSKLMKQMGYIIGTGLGKNCVGRIEPVSAVVLPPGKSLDHCMKLREKCGGDKNLFSAERKLKRLQRKQEIRNEKAYNREKTKKDVFSFINTTLSNKKKSEDDFKKTNTEYRQSLKNETTRSLNVESFSLQENIKRLEGEIIRNKEALNRQGDVKSQYHKSVMHKLKENQDQLKTLQARALSVKNEQKLRNDRKEMTKF